MSDCLLYALLSNYSEAVAWPPPNWPQPAPLAAIEIVDLASLRRVDYFEIGARKATGLELVGGRLYVVDPSHNEVVVLAVSPPGKALSVSPAPSDCVAAPDGSRVYVAGSEAIDVIDTSSLLVESVPFHSPLAASGVTISDDGATVVAVGERAGTGVAVVLDTATRSVREVDLGGANTALDAAFIKNKLAVVWTGSSFMQVDTSSATQVPGATVPTPGSGLGLTFGISTLQFSSPASRALAVDYKEVDFGFGSAPFGNLESLDLSTNQVSTPAPSLSLPPYLMRLAPPGDKLFLVEGHEVIGTADALSVFDLTTRTLTQDVYFFSSNLFVTDMRVNCPTGIPDWHWPPWPWPWAIPRRPLRGSGEGIWGFVDPLWDPHYGLAANIGLGLGGPLGRRIAAAIDNWRRRFSTPEEPG